MQRKDFINLTSLGLLSVPFYSFRNNLLSGKSKKVIIIGAGMAGAAAANALRSAGTEVTVLEARNRIGGRIHTDHSMGLPIDLGAAWIHKPTNNPLIKLSGDFKVATQETNYFSLKLYEPNGNSVNKLRLLSPSVKISKAVKQGVAFLQSSDADYSIAEILQRTIDKNELSKKEKMLMDFLEGTVENSLACGLNSASARAYLDHKEDTKKDRLVTGGYHKIVDNLLKDIDVKLSQPVKVISQDTGGVKVITDSHEFEGDYAIVTIPISLLQNNVVEFFPSLPKEKINAINSIKMGLMNKTVMKFTEKFWKNDKHLWGLLGEDNKNNNIILNNHPFNKQPILTVLSVNKAAYTLEKTIFTRGETGRQEIITKWKNTFHKIFPGRNIEIEDMITTQWHGDRFSNGSYSHVPVGVSMNAFDVIAAPLNRIHFAGEATIAQHHSYTHGAYLSGLREANRILNF